MTIRIITDGACRGNPGPGGWAALIIRDGEIEEIGGHEPHTTNNRMELRAAIEALRRVPTDARVEITTDSKYLMQGMTSWLPLWQRRGWTTSAGTPVENQDLWQTLAGLAGRRVRWQHVYGHSGHPENERANTIAQSYAAKREPSPVQQPLAPVAPVSAPPQAGLIRAIAARRPAARTYLSLVDGELQRHRTWDECRAQVHGASGARYKKCASADEELETVRAWGLPPDLLLRCCLLLLLFA